MIVHLCSNDSKFIDTCVIDVFNELNPNNNTFIVIPNKKNRNPIKKTDQVIFLAKNDEEILKLCNQANAVIIHAMRRDKAIWISKINKNVKVLWCCWGIDFYSLNNFERVNNKIYEPETQKLFNGSFHNTIFKKIKYYLPFFSKVYNQLRKIHPLIYRELDKAFYRINFVSTIIPTEYNIIKKTLPLNDKVSYVDFSYGNTELLFPHFYNKEYALGNKILLGNSSTYSNNHLDALIHLKKQNITNQIICPLNYGNEKIGKIITEKGKELFGNNFETLNTFLPLEEYVQYTTSCSVMIMNMKRQQAAGTILLGLYLGMRVYLNIKNPIFSFLKEKGVIVFDFYSDFTNTEECLSTLPISERDYNRNILEKIWGKEVVEKQIKLLIKELNS